MKQTHLIGLTIIVGCMLAGLLYYQHERGKLRQERSTFVRRLTMRRATAMVRDRQHRMNVLRARHGELHESATIVDGQVIPIRGNLAHLANVEETLFVAEERHRDAQHRATLQDLGQEGDQAAGQQANELLGLSLHAVADAHRGNLRGEDLMRCQNMANLKDQTHRHSVLGQRQTEAVNGTQYVLGRTTHQICKTEGRYYKDMSKATFLHVANNNGFQLAEQAFDHVGAAWDTMRDANTAQAVVPPTGATT